MTSIGGKASSLIQSLNPMKKPAVGDQAEEWHFEYSTVVGYFLQDSTRTNPGTFDAMNQNFGLIDQDYDTDKLLPANGKDLTQWQRFAHKVKILNERAPKDVTYRMLYLGRHGQGYHNVGSAFYGDNAWDCFYSTLDKDPHVPDFVWFDAHLTLLGKYQATLVSRFWHNLITTQKIPVPQVYYSSPQARAIQTAQISFSSLPLPRDYPFDPLIKELLREGHGIHTCDKRSTKTYLESTFPSFRIEEGFTEDDEIYSETLREPPLAHTHRMIQLLDDVFAHDSNTYISMTSHSGSIGAILRGIGHRAFQLPTGGVIPVFLKVRKVPGKRGDDGSGEDKWETKPDCVSDPLKARRPGNERYRDIAEYLEGIDRSVPKDEVHDVKRKVEIAEEMKENVLKDGERDQS